MRVPLFIVVALYLGGSLVVGSSPIMGTDSTAEDYRFSSRRRQRRRLDIVVNLDKKEKKNGMGIFNKAATAVPTKVTYHLVTGQPSTAPTGSQSPTSSPTAKQSPPPPKTGGGGPKGAKVPPDNSEKLKKKDISTKDKMDKLEVGVAGGMMGGKSEGGMMGGMGKSKGKAKSKAKSKGKGKGATFAPTSTPSGCASPLAQTIQAGVPEVTTKNPIECCPYHGPSTVFVTHALPDNSTNSGFEPFWDSIYAEIDQTSGMAGVCFVMTGYDGSTRRNLSSILIDVINLVSQQATVPAMMTTDPTSTQDVLNTVREISNATDTPSIGVFNAGYPNIVIEALVSGLDRLPYVGYQDDSAYGAQAAEITLTLLKGVPAVPLCFNGRPELDFIGQRCAVYYNDLTTQTITPPTGIQCNASTPIQDVYFKIRDSKANAVWSHLDCCSVVAQAAAMAKRMGQDVVVGCQDGDTSGGLVNFVTTQPVRIQGYSASTWVNLPVLQSVMQGDGRDRQYFPSLKSLLNTDIFNIVLQ